VVFLNLNGVAGRTWKSGNLLVEFDDAGIVKRVEPFDDARALRHLGPVAASTPLQLESPLELPVKYSKFANAQLVDAKIVLSKGTFDFEELGELKKKHKFSLPASEVLRVETPVTIRFPDPTYISQRLRCARNLKKIGGPPGRDLNLEVTMPQLVTLMSYVAQAVKSPARARPKPTASECAHKRPSLGVRTGTRACCSMPWRTGGISMVGYYSVLLETQPIDGQSLESGLPTTGPESLDSAAAGSALSSISELWTVSAYHLMTMRSSRLS